MGIGRGNNLQVVYENDRGLSREFDVLLDFFTDIVNADITDTLRDIEIVTVIFIFRNGFFDKREFVMCIVFIA